MKRILFVAVLIAVAWGVERWTSADLTTPPATDSTEVSSTPERPQSEGTSRVGSPQFESTPHAGSQFESGGTVIRVLADDNDGSRHQRFIVRLASGRTVLIAHNIDLAPRVAGLEVGDTVEFSGEFENNDKGGVVHWTHHDPQGRHVAGWIRHRGRTYQ
ncbi:MAG TPA: DUF3465 domain-containing protein [Steroidobacteraceae bacterium]|nr:DUF3465 domain-containing protein [Steroidobacteraceae bacterium]